MMAFTIPTEPFMILCYTINFGSSMNMAPTQSANLWCIDNCLTQWLTHLSLDVSYLARILAIGSLNPFRYLRTIGCDSFHTRIRCRASLNFSFSSSVLFSIHLLTTQRACLSVTFPYQKLLSNDKKISSLCQWILSIMKMDDFTSSYFVGRMKSLTKILPIALAVCTFRNYRYPSSS